MPQSEVLLQVLEDLRNIGPLIINDDPAFGPDGVPAEMYQAEQHADAAIKLVLRILMDRQGDPSDLIEVMGNNPLADVPACLKMWREDNGIPHPPMCQTAGHDRRTAIAVTAVGDRGLDLRLGSRGYCRECVRCCVEGCGQIGDLMEPVTGRVWCAPTHGEASRGKYPIVIIGSADHKVMLKQEAGR